MNPFSVTGLVAVSTNRIKGLVLLQCQPCHDQSLQHLMLPAFIIPNLSRRPFCKSCAITWCTPPRCATSLPSNYDQLREQATGAVQSALASKLPFLEVQFPAVRNMATAALNELLDANRDFTRSFLLSFTPRYAANSVIAVFPDVAEARLATKVYGEVPFGVTAIPKKSVPDYMKGEGVAAVVNPGFNVDEWINMEKLRGDKAVVTINADLDKVRGGYYPRLFYPRLWNVKTRFLSKFVAVYYIKMFSNGGTLFRCFPDNWKMFYNGKEGMKVLWEGEERPRFVEMEKLLAERRRRDLVGR